MSSASSPLRVAIIGSGPSAFYAADFLFKQTDWDVEIDMFERLPTPFGLVRGGVAPDHPKIKSVIKAYERTASHANFRFYGNVTFGRDITRADIQAHYHAVIYAVGAQTDRQMGIPGEDLPGSHAATEFVGWYNGHPDFRDLEFDLSQERVVVIGNGNVATDVARMLARTPDELYQTDIAPHALDALSRSNIKEIIVLGRRGPVQAKFTNSELKELGEMADAAIIVDLAELKLDPLSEEFLLSGEDRIAERNYQTLTRFSEQPDQHRARKIVMRFLRSPVELIGTDRVEAIRVVKNEICERAHFLSPCPTEDFETDPAGLVFRSIGYQGVPLPGVSFDAERSIIPNEQGRVVTENGEVIRGEYAVGWIKRGPSGIIGTNKPDAQETTTLVLEDVAAGNLLAPAKPARSAVEHMLKQRGTRYVTYEDWQILDRIEIERGQAIGRPRLKFTRVDDMLAAIDAHKRERLAEPAHLAAR